MSHLSGLRLALEQCQHLVEITAVDEEVRQGHPGIGARRRQLHSRSQGLLVAGRQQCLDLLFLGTHHELVHELAHHRFGLGTQKTVDHLSIDHRMDRRDGLRLERPRDLGVGLDVHLGEFDPAVGRRHHRLQDRSERLARPTPVSPEIHNHGNGGGPLDHLGLEGCVSHVCHECNRTVPSGDPRREARTDQRPAGNRTSVERP